MTKNKEEALVALRAIVKACGAAERAIETDRLSLSSTEIADALALSHDLIGELIDLSVEELVEASA